MLSTTTTEAEMLFPVRCPVCGLEALSGFRMGVIVDAFRSGQIRLYANCHLAGWDASHIEIEQIREYLDAAWSSAVTEACQEIDRELMSPEINPEYIRNAIHARPEPAARAAANN
jgi:hypothetical protein